MESLLGPRSVGEESLQMWDLNKRLEAYLARVKYLEGENELLKAKIQELRASPQEQQPWRSHYEGEVAALRAALDQAFREQATAGLARDSLYAEAQWVQSQWQKERGARDEAKRLLSLGKKELEEEKRAQLWLREKAAQLEKEMEALVQGHQEDLAALDQEMASSAASWALESFRAAPALAGSFPQAEVEDYAQRLSSLWKGAAETYQAEVCQLEAVLCQAKENLWRAAEGHRQSQQQLHQLENQLSGLKLQKEVLEESLAHDWQRQQGEAEKMQLAIESLEEEKRSLRVQIAQVLEDRQQLMHLKMSLSLEVATYRTLLETESTRLQLPASSFKIPSGLKESMFEASHSNVQAASLGRGYFGPQDFKPSPTSAPKGKPWLLKSQRESFATPLVSTLPTSCRSPVAREFLKANTVLRSQPSKTFDPALDPKDAPDFTEASAAFALGFPQQNKLSEAGDMESVSPSFFHDFPAGQNFLSHVNGEVSEGASGSSPGRRSQEDGQGGDEVTQREAEEPDPEGEEEEEEEEQPKEEASAAHDVPSLTQLVAGTLDVAATEVNGEKISLEPNSFTTSATQKGSPSEDEERNRGSSSPSREELEGEARNMVPEGQKRDEQQTDRPGEVKDVGHTLEANGGQESYPEWTEEEEEEEEGEGERLWASLETEPASSLQRGFPKEERGREATATGVVPLAAEMEMDTEERPSEQGRGPRTEEPPKVEQGQEPEETARPPPGLLGRLGKDAEQESWQPSSPSDPHRGALGGSVEEMEGRGGGEEDLEVGGTESSLHLSEEEEERRAPFKGEDECEELQAEMAGSDLGLEGGFALDQQPPISHTTSAVASGRELLSRPVAQEVRQEHSPPLSESDSALADEEEAEEEEERALGPKEETLSREKTPEARGEEEGGGENTLAGEVKVTGGRTEEDEEERKEEVPRYKDVAEEENPLGKGDTVERESSSNTEEEKKRHDFPLFHKGQDPLEKEETAEQEGVSGVEHTGQKDLQEESKLACEDRTGQDRLSGTETVGQKTPHKEENNLENEDTTEQEGLSDMEHVGHKDLQEKEREMENEDAIEQKGFSEVEHIGQKDLQEENKLASEDTTGQSRLSGTETLIQKPPHREENNLESEDTREQEGLSDMEHIGHKDLLEKEREMETEDTADREGFSEVENIGQKDLQEKENEMENEDSIDMESFLAMEDIGDQALHQEENHLGGIETAKGQEGFSSTENIGHLGLHREVKNLENEDTTDEKSLSGVETSKQKPLSQAKNNIGKEETVKPGGVTGVQDVGAKDLPKEENVLGNGPTTEEASFSDAEIIGAEDLQKEEHTLGNEDPAEEEFPSDIEMTSSQDEVTCQPGVAFLRDENILGQEGCEQQQAGETSSNTEEPPWMEGKEDTARLSPVAESDIIGEESKTGIEALAVGSEQPTGTWEMGEVTGAPKANLLEGEENSPQDSAAKESGTEALVAKEGPTEAAGGEEEDFHSQDPRPLGQGPVSQEPLGPPETHSHVADGLEAMEEDEERAMSHEVPSGRSGSEESLGSLDASPNATCEMEALGKEELRSRKEILLEETLPDNTPLYMYDAQMWGAAGTGQGFPESREAAVEPPPSSQGRCASPGLEEERLHGSPLRGNVREQEATEEEGKGHAEAVPSSQELPQVSTQPEETHAGKGGLSHESQDLHAMELEGPRREEGSAENPELLVAESDTQSSNIETSSSSMESSDKPIGQAHVEENGTDLGAQGSVPQADLLDAHHPKESCCEEDGWPLELSGGSNAEGGSGACKASPLTSVADLGEIVLEGDAVESDGFEAGREEGLPDVHKSQPLSQPRSCGTEEEEPLETHPGSHDFPAAATEAEGMKDADILEIVAQALEFNQELIKAAEERAEAELSAASGGEETIHPAEEKPPSDSVPLSEVRESQVSEDAPNVVSSSSSSTQDPTEANPLWAASDTNGLQLDPSLSDFTEALELNGIGGLRSPFAEEFLRKVGLTQEELHRDQTEGLSSTGDEMPPGKTMPLFPEEEFLDPKGPEEEEARERKESRTADQLQTAAGMKGRLEAEAMAVLPHLEVEIPGLEPGHLLKFQAGEEDVWTQEDD